ncbi:MAG TPA: c-type cytochrome [Bryobacteraceae bacterium]|jgi:putative heme-binding domain-containing protein
MRLIGICIFAVGAGVLLAQRGGPPAPVIPPPPGDAANGKAIFEGKGQCTNCHRVEGKGSHLGPDLSEIGARRPDQLQSSILDPDAEILPANRTYRVVDKNGTVTVGRLLNLDTFTVQLMDAKERLVSFEKSNLREYGFVDKSPMPSYKGKLTDQEIADLVNYLYSLKPPPRAAGGRGKQ